MAREIERIERRRQRRIERKTQRGEAQAAAAAPEPPKPREVETGSKVRMAGQDMVGVVQSVKGKKAQVAFGQILTTVDRKLLTVVSNSEFREATAPADGPYGGLGRYFGPQTQFQGPYRRAGHARRRSAGRRAGFRR